MVDQVLLNYSCHCCNPFQQYLPDIPIMIMTQDPVTQWAFQSAAESLESKLFIQRTVSLFLEEKLDHDDDHLDIKDG